MLALLFSLMAASFAEESIDTPSYIGARIEHMPIPEYSLTEGIPVQPWLPWGVYGTNQWLIKGSILSYGYSDRSKASETQNQTVASELFMALEVEKIYPLQSVNWHIGIGVQSNIPFVKQTSSQFTDLEQQDIDTQLQNTRAELSYTGVRLPTTIQIPIHSNVLFGIGLQNTLILQRSESDYTTYFNTTWRTSPLLSIQVQ